MPRTCRHTPVLTQTDLYKWTPALCPSLPPSLSPGTSPGVGRMDGLGALVTGFTRATASLGTCPHPKESAQGAWGRGGSSSRAMPFRGSWLPRLPGGPRFPFCLGTASLCPHLRARCCRQVAHLALQDHQGLLVGVWPLHEHSPAVLPGGVDTEFLSPSQTPRGRTLSATPVIVNENPQVLTAQPRKQPGRPLPGRGSWGASA